MSEIVDRLRAEADLIRGTALWKRYSREIEKAIEWYSKELRGNTKIGLPITNGAAWQDQLNRLYKISNLLDSIIDDATRADEDRSGQPS